MTGSEGAEAAGDNGGGIAADPELRRLMLHRERLLSGTSPDLAAELDAGARAAQAVLDKHGGVFADAGLLMSAMAAEILDRKPEPGTSRAAPASDVAGKLSLLLLLGAIIRLARRRAGANARPILVIENPESNLHPMTLASVWRITERIVWQKIIATNSGTILASAPLGSLRRLTRSEGIVTEWSVTPRSLSREAIRRVSYHLRSRRAAAMFARCWILVEGETEYWILPELARICGYDLGVEGVTCVEFAQCGLPPLIKLADQLGIASHVLVDGDTAGDHYADSAGAVKCARNTFPRLVTKLKDRDIEHCFWQSGFAEVIRKVAYPGGAVGSGSPSSVIRKAIERTSKPFLALSLIDAAARRGAGSVPAPLREVVESAVRAARGSVLHRIR